MTLRMTRCLCVPNDSLDEVHVPPRHRVLTITQRIAHLALRAGCALDRYQNDVDHSLIDLESGMVNWYLRIPLSSLILLSSDGAVFSRDPCIGLLQCSGKRKNMAGKGRKQPEKVGYGKKRDGI